MKTSRPGFLRRVLLGAAIVLPLGLAGCAQYEIPAPVLHKSLIQPYRLDSGDVLRITVFEQNDLTNTYKVDKAGFIAFPLIGSVVARGRTIKRIEADIARKLADGFIRDPDVSVQVATYRPFFILGEVETGGQYTYTPGMTVLNAVAIAGGYTPRAAERDVDLTRHVNGKVIAGRVAITDPILPGDTIVVRERLF